MQPESIVFFIIFFVGFGVFFVTAFMTARNAANMMRFTSLITIGNEDFLRLISKEPNPVVFPLKWYSSATIIYPP